MPKVLTPFSDEDGNMSTLPDPRNRATSPANDSGMSSPSQHPDLNSEVATLSNKLISAINHQTTLDDTLSVTRHELEQARERMKKLESDNREYTESIARGVYVKRTVMEMEKAKITIQLVEEKRQRAEVEKEKKNIEQELENLTTALFEEANKMVITAREEAQREHDIIQKRNDQLKAQLADTESLLRFQQEQLAELKHVMEQMKEERDDQTNPTAPSTPGLSKFDSKENSDDADGIQSSIPEPVSPTYPTSFTHLLQTVLRTDLSAYDDFASLLRLSKNVPINSRTSSGTYTGLGLGLGGYSSSMPSHTNGSSTSLSTVGSTPVTPTTPVSTVSTGSTNGHNSLTPLKETKFYKRALAEDIEPTLRLDTAPGLSWLARRTVLNAVCDGTLVVEPMPQASKSHTFPCSLCGELRKDPEHIRTHRFRTNENDNAQRYPLCRYCLGRVRSTCDFVGFLRILKDGHWRCEDEESERAAWEESVRLREQMFWCRVGGGVIPAHPAHPDFLRSPRTSEDKRKEVERKISEELERTGEIQPKDITPVPTPSKSSSKVSIREHVVEAPGLAVPSDARTSSPTPSPLKEVQTIEHSATTEAENKTLAVSESPGLKRESSQSTTSLQVISPGGDGKEPMRLSITIPGSFD